MSEHVSGEELHELQYGTLPPGRASAILFHLMRCESCLEAVPEATGALLGTLPVRAGATVEEEAAYEAAIARAAVVPLQHEERLRRQRAEAEQLAARLAEEGVEVLVDCGAEPMVVYEALLQQSWKVRHEKPHLMVDLARHAVLESDKLSEGVYGEAVVADFRCRAWTELANAERVADLLDDALYSLNRAHDLFQEGSGDRTLEVRLLTIQASVAAARRQFGQARIALDWVYRFYRRHGLPHMVGRTLIKAGLYAGYAGEPDEAIRLLRQGLNLVDEKREPGVVTSGLHNLLLFLVEANQFKEARKHLLRYGARLRDEAEGRVPLLKLRGVEGRIALGLKNYRLAEEIFRHVTEAFDEAGLQYKAALMRLYLGESLIGLRMPKKARGVVSEAIEVFKRLRIGREQLIAVNFLVHAVNMEERTDKLRHMVREVATYLQRAEHDPAMVFDPQAF